MDHSESMLYAVRVLSQAVMRNIEQNARDHSYSTVSPIQMMILDYLSRSADREIFQKDIAEVFHIRNSSVTAIIQNMEKNAMIERRAVESDARLKRICITQKGAALSEKCRRDMDEMEKLMRNTLDEEERRCFFSISEKLIRRLNTGGFYDKETC
ncbi:MAG: MarR family transcriptional regulator [Eubacteriaceae bacterium]|nr:MarR family transcriptional regulator [Eubacteriaceae bacterium]MCR4893314.1 MarR family transcriptional regulator [Eubacteriales bacterium]